MKNGKIELIINAFFSTVIVGCLILTIVFNLSWLAFVSCTASIFYIVFLSQRNILNFIVGFISSSTYIVVAYQSKLYGEAIFYLVVDIPMIFISFFMWRKHMETKYKVETKKLSIKNILLILCMSVVLTIGYGFVLKFLGGANPFVDALSTVATCTATLLMALRYREQWIMWIVVYVISIVLWTITFDLLMLIMSICCFISSLIGYVQWSRNTKKQTVTNAAETE